MSIKERIAKVDKALKTEKKQFDLEKVVVIIFGVNFRYTDKNKNELLA